MYFILSKLLLVLILPLTWVVVLLVAGLIVKRPGLKRWLLVTGVMLLLLFSNRLLLRCFSSWWDVPPREVADGRVYSAAIILGGYAQEDSEGKGYFGPSANRFIQAVKLKNAGNVQHLVITGGNAGLNPSAFREGAWVQQQVKHFNVPDSAVLVDPDSRNTLENALYTRRLLDSSKLKPPYLLVTSVYHMRRSQYIFRKAGMSVVPYACEFNGDSEVSWDDLLPDAAVMPAWNLYIKEMVGYLVAHVQNIPGR
ncbi:hypothetical protein DJ568_08795 [Mucilaginibacter hurinus]|uniref:DUF218 domain-containing protein n=1 Tax=Mucilaginibacter hurinus TaxID=2201324 RepID=A0A367GP54_9SPHI|nr:YdcF family protein [Mucilaginibacter hurinus]RCH55272.1 hypothetical protein DJ568_08795 [Mucilaginibacter hurinus]